MSAIASFIGLFLIIYGIKTDKGHVSVIGGVFMILAIVLIIFYIRTGHIVGNDNDETWIKPEHSPEPQYLPKGKKANNIDGVATQKGIFKVPNATAVKIDALGNVRLTSEGKFFNSLLKLNAGYKDQQFLQKNPNWQMLYDKQQNIKA
jgi:hypothetical protein